METTQNSIFYSVIKEGDQLVAFGRKDPLSGRIIKKITLDEDFNTIEDIQTEFKGEDPRCFYFKDKLYVLDNYWDDMFLIDYKDQRFIPVPISGKNISFLVHEETLYFIYYIKPFELYRFDIETCTVEKIEVEDDKNTYNYEYRGGTPGYKLTECSYYGIGHRTYYNNNVLIHDVFKWVLSFEKIPRIEIFTIEQPPQSKNICDPTSVIELNSKKYLITAEAEHPWFCEQDYITNVYEILE